MGSCAAPSAKGDDKFITTDYLQQCPFYNHRLNNVSISDVKNHDTGKKSGRVESQNYSLL
ncbi:hypothetical protein DBZ77_10505 [Salmonella enterica subsp. enterica serovar Bovismorbificans]|nr:hypothetical protein DBZ77_10505 [Salmonella enterica subsp. enterica serovar Bovismorbificans]